MVSSSDHPRACGELCPVPKLRVRYFGSSPRMRGTHPEIRPHEETVRIIPAHAGNSHPARGTDAGRPDHPRACGELVVGPHVRQWGFGSSPRMRGTRLHCCGCKPCLRIIPAHAGNSSRALGCPSRGSDHPRACGELVTVSVLIGHTSGSSPRMRGTPPRRRPYGQRRRIIPAHAGNSDQSG